LRDASGPATGTALGRGARGVSRVPGPRQLQDVIEVEIADSQATPEEVLESTFDSIGQSVESDLLERVKAAPPIFFEQLVVDLLVAMGYGGSTPVKRASRRVGRSGDEGIY
jgi:restriction system protein